MADEKQNIILEEWRPVVGYEGKYEVSQLGRVRSISRHVNNRYREGRVLVNLNHDKGYYTVNLCRKTFFVHRLVAKAFIPNPNCKPDVNHIDGDKKNANVSNLEWVTEKENAEHSVRTGLHKHGHLYGIEHGMSRKCNQYLLSGEFVKTWDFIRQAALELSISENTINAVCSKKKGRAGMFQWRYYKRHRIGRHTGHYS